MNANENVENVSEVRAYLIMILTLLFPIILYIVIRSAFRSVLSLAHTPIVPMMIFLVANILSIVYLHVIDYREMKAVCGDTGKLLAAVLLFQPIYFVCRQDILGRPRKGAIIYGVVSTLEIVVVIIVYVIACLNDAMELIW